MEHVKDFFNFVHDQWPTLVAVISGIWTLIQEFRHQVVKRKS